DQLASLRLLQAQSQAQGRAVDAARRASTISETRWRNGLVSQLELLDARRSELRNRRDALHVRAAQYQATVALIRAIGGEWQPPGEQRELALGPQSLFSSSSSPSSSPVSR
uniref:TolC family protein n=1 Tax=Ramlibacter sp. TaxID=1917967 RepID=UPI0017ED93B3